MTVYPGAIDQFRVHNNLPGMNYDAEKADIIYAEDINKINENIVAIETTLGVDFLNIWPIGSIYQNATDSRNPHDIMGFGTWVVYGAGRVIVGKSASGTFIIAGATGGAETHSLTKEQQANMRVYGGDKWNMTTGGTNPGYVFNPVGANNGVHEATAIGGGVTGEAHNNLQPYKVAYMWERTA